VRARELDKITRATGSYVRARDLGDVTRATGSYHLRARDPALTRSCYVRALGFVHLGSFNIGGGDSAVAP